MTTTHETQYEHCILPNTSHIIRVRRVGEEKWRRYMRCKTAQEAREKLALLEQPMGAEAVLL